MDSRSPGSGHNGCTICGTGRLTPWLERSDGIAVLACTNCGMGRTAEPPVDLRAYYQDDYYTGADQELGYADHAFVGEHSTAWAARLVDHLAPARAVLDVGPRTGTCSHCSRAVISATPSK